MLPRKTIRSSAAFFGKSLSPFLPSPRPRLRVRLRFAIQFYESAEPHAQCQTGAIFPAGTRIASHLNPRTYLTLINVDSPRAKARNAMACRRVAKLCKRLARSGDQMWVFLRL